MLLGRGGCFSFEKSDHTQSLPPAKPAYSGVRSNKSIDLVFTSSDCSYSKIIPGGKYLRRNLFNFIVMRL
jgi:hypothetical protein